MTRETTGGIDWRSLFLQLCGTLALDWEDPNCAAEAVFAALEKAGIDVSGCSDMRAVKRLLAGMGVTTLHGTPLSHGAGEEEREEEDDE